MKTDKVMLGELATVEVSGVDKKSQPLELPVKLCNFVDVYYNWSITESMRVNFIDATVKKKELDTFKINKGQVAITKDSETRYDIGMAAYIADDFDNVVLGYHCALITPHQDKLDGRYLNALLHTNYARNYFSNNASGSGQRYTLSSNCIKNLPLCVPSIAYQRKISDLLDQIDRKIRNNNKINIFLDNQIKCLYEYEFIQHANEQWHKVALSHVADMYQPQTISTKDLDENGLYTVYGANGIIGKYNSFNHKEHQIAVACRGASCGAVTMTLPNSWITGNAMIVSPKSGFPYKEFLYYTLIKKSIAYLTSGSAQPQLTRENMSIYPVLLPSQEKLDEFERYAASFRKKIIQLTLENNKLLSIRDWLLPMLINGQATVAD